VLEFTGWNGEAVRLAFGLDCHDREAISWVATTGGISGEMIRDMMFRCVERRFAAIRAPHPVAVRQRLDLRRQPNHRDRSGAQPAALLRASRKPRQQRHGRSLHEDLQARLCPG
jgi:hypothetical protein